MVIFFVCLLLNHLFDDVGILLIFYVLISLFSHHHALPLCKSVFLLTNYLVVAFLDDETKGSNIFSTTHYFRNF